MRVTQGTIGCAILFDVGESLADADLSLLYEKPDRTTGEWVASAEGTQLQFVTADEGDLDVPGVWKVQAKVARLPSEVGYSSIDKFTVTRRIA